MAHKSRVIAIQLVVQQIIFTYVVRVATNHYDHLSNTTPSHSNFVRRIANHTTHTLYDLSMSTQHYILIAPTPICDLDFQHAHYDCQYAYAYILIDIHCTMTLHCYVVIMSFFYTIFILCKLISLLLCCNAN